MQKPNEERQTNGNAKEEKEVIIIFDTALPEECYTTVMAKVREGEVWQFSMVCDPTDWDVPHVYPKKRKKRKKGFDREIIRVENNIPSYRRLDPLFKQRPHAQHGTSRKNRI